MANRYIQQDVEERMTLLGISGERERSKFINDALRMELERMEAIKHGEERYKKYKEEIAKETAIK